MEETIIDAMYRDNKALTTRLGELREVSFESDADSKLRKVLVLAAASYFESVIQDIISRFVERVARNDERVCALVKAKAISRQYHTYFQWDGKNANSFFRLFGDGLATRAKAAITARQELSDSIQAFLTLGNLRNELVHLNFAGYVLEKTGDEVYALYRRAWPFVEFIEQCLAEEAEQPCDADGSAE